MLSDPTPSETIGIAALWMGLVCIVAASNEYVLTAIICFVLCIDLYVISGGVGMQEQRAWNAITCKGK